MRGAVLIGGALAAIMLAASSSAQDGSEASGARSPESAQRFLREILVRPQRIWHSFKAYRSGTDVSFEPQAGAQLVPASGEIVDVSSDDPCRTRLQLAQAQVAQGDNLQINGGRIERVIDWSKAERLEPLYSTITSRDPAGNVTGTRNEYVTAVHMQGGWQELSFTLPSEAENKRLMFAMDFLRTSCELKSDTGF